MKAYALVQGPRRKVLYVSDSCAMLWTLGAETFEPSGSVNFRRNERAICKKHDAYIVRVDYQLGEPITAPRKKAEKQAA
jgi:hypothetical protein